MSKQGNLYFAHISIHGLIRGHNLELGRDADTGGQCKYVLELVKSLGQHPRVSQVDLFTRLIKDPRVSSDYSQLEENLGNGVFIRRIVAGPKRYLRKESLWRYLDAFLDETLATFRERGRLPDIIHAHYADAGYVGSRLATLLGCPFIFTGHSLGRTKLHSLLEADMEPKKIERLYNIKARIEAEERSLDAASLVCTSTQQEVEEQYSLYENYVPERMRVIPPGVDVSAFGPPQEREINQATRDKIERFLLHPERPAILAIARADLKKNLATLVRAFGESSTLRHRANLIIIAGNRSQIKNLKPGARKVWRELLHLIDDYDLYGCVAIPKQHESGEIPSFYRYAAEKKGLFVNPALTEPFGLTVIEAAASGVPVLATNDGGPNDILRNCKNGMLIDPLDCKALTRALESSLADTKRWERWSENGIRGVAEHYTWETHVKHYMQEMRHLLDAITAPQLITEKIRTTLPLKDRMIFSGLEDELLEGDREAIAEFKKFVDSGHPKVGYGVCTARSLKQAQELIEKHGLPQPDVYLTQLGGEVYYGKRLVKDERWERHVAYRWQPEKIKELLSSLDGIRLQSSEEAQHRLKISYDIVSDKALSRAKLQRLLREHNLPAKVICSLGKYIDVVPLRSGKGQAIRYAALRWRIPFERILFYARRGSDYSALSGHFLAVLGSDHAPELARARYLPSVYLASRPNMQGLMEGIRAYHFDTDIEIPKSAEGLKPDPETSAESVMEPDLVADPSEEKES